PADAPGDRYATAPRFVESDRSVMGRSEFPDIDGLAEGKSRSNAFAHDRSRVGAEVERTEDQSLLIGGNVTPANSDTLKSEQPASPVSTIPGTPGLLSFGAALHRNYTAVQRGVIAYSRVSSPAQNRNQGSRGLQRDQLLVLEPYGVDISTIEVVECTESAARPNGDRSGFEYVLGQVRRGKVGVVVVIMADRVARNDHDARRLYDALTASGGLVLITGQFYDPADPAQRFILNIHAVTAEFENMQRSLRLLMSSCALARRLQYPVALPAGLTWACTDDDVYRQAVEAEGLADMVAHDALAQHKARWRNRRNGQQYYVLHDPAPGVFRSAQLRMQWLLETRSIAQVIDRIDGGYNDWPVRGHIPIARTRTYDPDRPPEWVPLGAMRRDGRIDIAHGTLRQWFLSPALYGVYRFAPAALQRVPQVLHALGTVVDVPDAFPSLSLCQNRQAIIDLFRGTRRPFSKRHDTPRDHQLAMVRCGAPLPDNSICGLRLFAAPHLNGHRTDYQYHSHKCRTRGHGMWLPTGVEDAAIDVIRQAVSPEVLAHALAQVHTREGADAAARKRCLDEIAELQSLVRVAVARVEACGVRGDHRGAEFWEARRFEHATVLEQKDRELRGQERDAAKSARLTADDESAIRELGTSLDELLAMAASIPGKRREILAEFHRRVYVWVLGTGFFEIVVEFPGGLRIEAVVACGMLVKCRQPAMALAYEALWPWVDRAKRRADPRSAEQAARNLAEQWNRLRRSGSSPWTARRVWGAALLHHYFDALPDPMREAIRRRDCPHTGRRRLPSGAPRTVLEIAEEAGQSTDGVIAAALAGRLGVASITPNAKEDVGAAAASTLDLPPERASITFAISTAHLHRAFPQYAKEEVARSAGWDVDDTVPIEVVIRNFQMSRKACYMGAHRYGVLVSDLSGRLYTRRSMWPRREISSLDAALESGPPAARELDSEYWLNCSELRKQLPRVAYQRALRRAPCVLRVEAGVLGAKRENLFVWLG